MVAPSSSTDLTSKLLPHLDRHLALPLLDFLENRGSYTHDAVLKAKYKLLLPTNMVTFVLGLKREIDGTTEENAVVPEGQFQLFSIEFGRVLMDSLGDRIQNERGYRVGYVERSARSSASCHGCHLQPRGRHRFASRQNAQSHLPQRQSRCRPSSTFSEIS